MDENRVSGAVNRGAGKVEDVVGAASGDIGEQVKGRMKDAFGAAQSLYGRAADRTRGVAGDIDTIIDDKPYAALAVAAAAGFALGLLLGVTVAGRD
ncbi:MAG TPA: hypothetical protein VFC47_14115 [Caulobacteraceae bacterium]|nr:hypothetical protein [Caulobacteraceae bacterium]